MLSKLIGKSGEVEFNAVLNETIEMQNRVTSFPVEDGQDIADHVSKESDSVPISGVVAGEDASQKLRTLRDFRNNKEVLTLIGRNVITNVVIESLMTRHNARVRDGFEFDITLRKVRFSRVQEVQIAPIMIAQTHSETNVKKVQDQGIQQPKRKEPFFTFRARGSD